MRRLGALGTLVRDSNWHPAVASRPGEPLEQWGGAAYSYAALSACCPAGWEVHPIVKVGEDLAAEALRLLRSLPGFRLGGGVRQVPQPNNRVELRYRDEADRYEVQLGGVPGWSAGEVAEVVAPLDAVYVNFLSGAELDLEAARALRRQFEGFLYADLHSLFLSAPGKGARVHRPLPRAEQWLGCFDAVQVNETELRLLAGGEADPERALPRLLEHGPRLAVVTLGERGARFAARPGLPADPLRWRHHPAAPGVEQGLVRPPLGALHGDPTGCGDVWGGTFVAALLAGLGVRAAMHRAQTLAAAKILHPDTATLPARLREALAEADAA
jgi:sugar/nucleoside kinase (ribokinase family)